jgi:hypothetical protein
MRMIKIETNKGIVLVNPKQIVQIKNFEGTIMIATADGHGVATKFTTIDHALDYIQRASSHSLVGG